MFLFGIFYWFVYYFFKWFILFELLMKFVCFNGFGLNSNLFGLVLWLKEVKFLVMEIGEWGFYVLIVLLVVLFWLVIKYKLFWLIYCLMVVVYLLIVLYSVILLKKVYWGELIYWLIMLFIVVGLWVVCYSLFGLVGW